MMRSAMLPAICLPPAGLRVTILIGWLLVGAAACSGARLNAAQVEGSTAEAESDGEHADRADRQPNRLIRESSPYLLLHARNPVDWYPWGPEALERAKREGKPIFLSIGYSSCYWCHVMERRVFEDPEIAAYMNEHFINIKVDREERPDIDEIYMTSLQVYFQLIGTRQSGGWPLSMFLTPDGKPIAGGTYFPPESGEGRVGFPDVMRKMVEVWTQQRAGVEGNAELISREVRRLMKPKLSLTPPQLDPALVTAAVRSIADSYDREYGGVGFDPARPDTPKFPTPPRLALLQYAARRHDDQAAEKIVLHTLDALAAGGIRDHLGGGFHRYSTDREWLVPHFEKMLYDQAQLADVYVEAFRRTGEPRYRAVAEDTLGFVLREMTDPEGGFHSALDAETDGIEGQFYVWSREEVQDVLGADEAGLFLRAYGLTERSRFEHGYILHLPQPLAMLATELRLDAGELQARLEASREKLLAVRNQRKPLLKDDKVLASWNGLMIHAFARAGQVLDRPDYVDTAATAATFVLTHMRDDQKRLQRTWRGGKASLNAYLDDYAFLVRGLLALHEATGDAKWLNAARRLTDQQIERFWDETGKAFYFTSHDHEELLARTRNAYSSVLPAGNAIAVRNLLRLASLSGEDRYRDYARQTLEVFAPELPDAASGMADLAQALGEYLDKPDFAAGGDVERPRSGPQGEPASPPPAESAPPHDADDPAGRSPADDPGAALDDPQAVLQAAAEGPPKKNGADKPEIVTAKAFLDVDRLPAGGTCRIVVFLEIAEGWHINTNPAQPENLIPTKFTIESKAGTELRDVQYPAGRKLEVDGIDEPLIVYEQRAAIRGMLVAPQAAETAADEIELRIRYQPCDDRQCLAPRTLKLTGRVPLARRGEPVKAINQNLFPKRGDEARGTNGGAKPDRGGSGRVGQRRMSKPE
jgi:uncharacterized protein YyaL (SSP411 family)